MPIPNNRMWRPSSNPWGRMISDRGEAPCRIFHLALLPAVACLKASLILAEGKDSGMYETFILHSDAKAFHTRVPRAKADAEQG